eukprot:NODE_7654_length_752_cov_67.470588_g7405_i0.p1 GENE.NODE_7654_length_752_cov_67.470588_g7405_i0~~NODE_7654_length_752_cov_67.470588_g7405_i0.p1  ORF type:complete len:206 (-),score=11.49 NODE_7654_length_752_cov_67.470588_g7405_i0:55-672(-)
MSNIFVACRKGDSDRVLALVKDDPSVVHQCYEDGDTVLHRVAHHGHLACVEVLLEHGAPVDARNDADRCTALHCASITGQVDCARVLLEHGAQVNALNTVGGSPALFACANGRAECLRVLLDHRARVDDTVFQDTPLQLASKYGHLDCVRLLLEHGARVDVTNRDGNGAIQLARARNNRAILQLLSDCVPLLLLRCGLNVPLVCD